MQATDSSKVLKQARVQRLISAVRTVLSKSERIEKGIYRIDPADWLALRSAAAQVGRHVEGTGGSEWD